MLEDSLITSRSSARTKKPFTVVLSVITHSVVIAGLVLIPLFQTPLLPQPPAVPLLRPPETRAVRLVSTPPRGTGQARPQPARSNDLIAPPEIPQTIRYVIDEPANDGFLPGVAANLGIAGGGGDPFGGFSAAFVPPPPPPRPPVAPPPPPLTPDRPEIPAGPVRMPGGQVEKSNLIYQVTPVYPELAKRIRVEGVVLLEAIITREGTIDKLRVLSGHPLLNEAAEEAVRQWRYRATLLNGKPVEVITTISVSFRLSF